MNAVTFGHILSRHGIHRQFWHEYRLLVVHGKRPSRELQTRLTHVANYKAALEELHAVSKPFESLELFDESHT